MDRLTKVVVVVVMLLAVLSTACHAQPAPPSCATKLLPCLDSLNMSRPPETCCKPLAEAVAHDMPCLCIIFSSPEILKAFNLNLQAAMMLSTGCGLSSDQTVCSPAGPSAAPSVNSGALPFKVKWIGVVFVMTLPFFY